MTIKKVSIAVTILGIIGLTILQIRPKINYHTINIELAGQKITVDIADTMATRAKGLGGRDGLNNNQGMLFIFNNSAYQTFWMMGMRIPIDIIWLQDDKIVDITENTPAPRAGELNLPTYKPSQKANKVLELKAGWVEQFKVKIGDRVIF